MAINIYTDGGCYNNATLDIPKGVGGWAVLFESNNDSHTLSGSALDTTSNRMELTAVIKALEIMPDNVKCNVYTDSQYVKEGITSWIKKWRELDYHIKKNKPIKNEDLWRRLDGLSSKRKVSWFWVKGHSGVNGNEIVDQLATQEMNKLIEQIRNEKTCI